LAVLLLDGVEVTHAATLLRGGRRRHARRRRNRHGRRRRGGGAVAAMEQQQERVPQALEETALRRVLQHHQRFGDHRLAVEGHLQRTDLLALLERRDQALRDFQRGLQGVVLATRYRRRRVLGDAEFQRVG